MVHLKDYVKINNKNFFVSTTNTFDKGWETMVFEADENNNIKNWAGLYCKHYTTLDEATEGHIYVKNHIDEYIPLKDYTMYEPPNLCEENKSCIEKIKDLFK